MAVIILAVMLAWASIPYFRLKDDYAFMLKNNDADFAFCLGQLTGIFMSTDAASGFTDEKAAAQILEKLGETLFSSLRRVNIHSNTKGTSS